MQPDPSHWRLEESYDYLQSLSPEGLAWEFLRRNRNYQRDYNTHKSARRLRDRAELAKSWGLQFLADPRNSALDEHVYWSPKVNPTVLVITKTPDIFESKMPLDIPIYLTRKSAGHLNATSVIGDLPFNIIFAARAKPHALCAAVLPLDDDCPSRIEALTRFWQALRGRPVPLDTRLTAQQRRRIRLMMQAVDGRSVGSTYREIADAIYGTSRVAIDAWKTSALRDSTIALVRDGKAMVEGEYRQLLKHRRRG